MGEHEHFERSTAESEERLSSGNSVLRPMVLSLIQSSYTRTDTFIEFAHDVFDIVTAAVTVPVAFAEGFLKSFLAIDSVVEDEAGRVTIRPKPGASEEEIIREVDEITARVDPRAIYNPVVRRQFDRVAEASEAVMKQDLEALADLSADELHDALVALEPTPEQLTEQQADLAAIRERMDKVRLALRRYQHDPEERRESAPPPPAG